MKTASLLPLVLALALNATAEEQRPKVDVVFVLDTTGSMSGLIQGAKDKIWSIANEMVSTKPAPEIRFGLVGYRDRSDAYVTKRTDLTQDIDAVYTELVKFQAEGGGDTPESVNQALHEAVTQMSWNPARDVLKIIFLVGDAPPHMDYENETQYPQICKMAVKKDLIINTIQCGSMSQTTPIWKEIADKAEGQYAAILQDGGTVAVSTPFDDEIATLNRALSETVIGYGDRAAQSAVEEKIRANRSAKAEALSDRAEFLVRTKSAPSAAAKVIGGDQDVVALIDEGKLDYGDIDRDQLPAGLKDLPAAEQRAAIKANLARRTELNQKLEDLVEQRSTFLVEEKKRQAKAGEDSTDGFDLQVKEMVRKQAASKGIEYDISR